MSNIQVDVFGRKFLQLLQHTLLAFFMDVVRVVVVVVDGEVLGISQKLLEFLESILGALL